MTERRGNALRQGAQAWPPRREVLHQLECILGREPTSLELLDSQLELLAALRFAECEARREKAHARCVAVQDLHRHAELDDVQEQLNDLLSFKWIEDDTTRKGSAADYES